MTDAPAHRWRAVTASVRGSAHVRQSLPNQDAVVVGSSADGGLAVAVSDGHGSKDSFRSDVGAQFAATIATRLAVQLLESGDHLPAPAELETSVDEFVGLLVTTWREEVEQHLAAHPVSDDELAGSPGGRALNDSDPLRAYGATLLLVVVSEGGALIVQLGDGDIVLLDASGVAGSPLPEDATLIANETTSLCMSDAVRRTRWEIIDFEHTAARLIFLASDGYGNSFVDNTWREDVTLDFARHLEEHGFDWVEERLPQWLEESADVAGDDVSLALLAPVGLDDRVAAVAPIAVAPVVARVVDVPSSPTPATSVAGGDGDNGTDALDELAAEPRPPARRRRVVIALALGVLAVLAAAGAVVAFSSSGSSGSDAKAPPTTTTTPRVTTTASTADLALAIPDVVGKLYAEAESELTAKGFVVVRDDQYDPTVEFDHVIAQIPAALVAAPKGSTVTLTVSIGPAPTTTTAPPPTTTQPPATTEPTTMPPTPPPPTPPSSSTPNPPPQPGQ